MKLLAAHKICAPEEPRHRAHDPRTARQWVGTPPPARFPNLRVSRNPLDRALTTGTRNAPRTNGPLAMPARMNADRTPP